MSTISKIQDFVIANTPLDFSEPIWIELANLYNVVKLLMLRKLRQQR